MGDGAGIFLLAVGLVLALAVGDSLDGVDLRLVGWILAGVGALALVLVLVTNQQRTHRTARVEQDVHREDLRP
jgi:hypothetical protein